MTVDLKSELGRELAHRRTVHGDGLVRGCEPVSGKWNTGERYYCNLSESDDTSDARSGQQRVSYNCCKRVCSPKPGVMIREVLQSNIRRDTGMWE